MIEPDTETIMSKKPRNESKAKKKPPPKMTDQERHRRFVDMAREVEADEDPHAFDAAFDKVAGKKS